ncbi:unnamed protein product [Heligmosomoides polygyrus]|uniref:Endo/exonuclease/phosphatase domain-containing protein n=1 Tax=Heligmosomoides polygyrus TaxID=6339 RepID=A0A183FQL4_HELPZ|nr:unnamed protein product [Heligmosomoides polygyrus]
MDSLLLLCRVGTFLVRGSGMFVHSVRGCVRDCADCNCVVAYAPTSVYDDEEVEAFYVELEKFYKEVHTFYKVIVGDFNAHSLEWNEQGERLSEFIMSTKTIHGNSQF